jgi:hypothetical protein
MENFRHWVLWCEWNCKVFSTMQTYYIITCEFLSPDHGDGIRYKKSMQEVQKLANRRKTRVEIILANAPVFFFKENMYSTHRMLLNDNRVQWQLSKRHETFTMKVVKWKR